MRWTLRRKLSGLAAVGVFGTLLVAAAGLTGLRAGQRSAAALVAGTRLQRQQMDVDMMHDAIRADVLAAILATRDTDATALQGTRTELAEHTARMRESVTGMRGTTDPAISTAVAAVTPVLDRYLASADGIVAGRSGDLPGFLQDFAALEQPSSSSATSSPPPPRAPSRNRPPGSLASPGSWAPSPSRCRSSSWSSGSGSPAASPTPRTASPCASLSSSRAPCTPSAPPWKPSPMAPPTAPSRSASLRSRWTATTRSPRSRSR
ncbi:MAG: hypothetical protein IPJ78_19020 [Gemmatimonadetes bacterium]|nr:hypothetical protein [Gemmatimonadota bacterium]